MDTLCLRCHKLPAEQTCLRPEYCRTCVSHRSPKYCATCADYIEPMVAAKILSLCDATCTYDKDSGTSSPSIPRWIKFEESNSIQPREGFRVLVISSPLRSGIFQHYFHDVIALFEGEGLWAATAYWRGVDPESAKFVDVYFPMRKFPRDPKIGDKIRMVSKKDNPTAWMFWKDIESMIPAWSETQSL